MCTIDATEINLTESQYDQDSYWGRVRHHLQIRNPLRIFTCPSTLEEAKCLYLKYRCGEPLPEDIDENELWRAKAIYESAYNPETGEKINFFARPSVQVPVNALLAGGMLANYQSTVGQVLWQWLNQTYNTFVNFAKRDAEDSVTNGQLVTSYVMATGTAIGTALGLKHFLRNSPSFFGRFVPLAAVAAAHCVNVPIIRAQTLKNGAAFYDDCNYKLGYSKRAAQAGISGIILGKILNAVPPLALSPFFMNYLESRGTLCRYPWLNFPANAAFALFCLTFLSPLTCALLKDKGSLSSKHLEPELQEYMCKKFYGRPPKYVYYDRSS